MLQRRDENNPSTVQALLELCCAVLCCHSIPTKIMRKISAQRRRDIISKLRNGLSHRQIAKEVRVSTSTVSKIRQSMAEDLPVPKIGRPKKLGFHHQHFLEREFRRNTLKTVRKACQAIRECFNISVSRTTVQKQLIKLQLRARVIIKRPLLTRRHKQDRLRFAQLYKGWTVDDWKNVVWSDETKINCLGSDGRRYCWVKASALPSNLVRPTMKYGGGSIMVWGCMTYAGVGKMTVINGIMDSEMYVDILNRNLIPSMQVLWTFNSSDYAIFQQDNDPKHTSGLVREWLNWKGINRLAWPAQSRDLNPIEHLWGLLKRRLGQYPAAPKGQLELMGRVEEEWAKIPPQECQALIDSMPQRIQAVIRAEGGHTKY